MRGRKPSLSPSPSQTEARLSLTERERELLLLLVRNAVALLDFTGQHPAVAELVLLDRKLEGLVWPTVKEQMAELLAEARPR